MKISAFFLCKGPLGLAALISILCLVSSAQSLKWTPRDLGLDGAAPSGAAYGNGRFVVVTTGSRVATSADASAWTAQSLPIGARASHLTFGRGMFIASGYSSAKPNLWTSPDGVTWTAITVGGGVQLNAAAASDSLFIAVSSSTGRNAVISLDGVVWTQIAVGDPTIPGPPLVGIVYQPARRVFVAWGGGALWVTTNGIDWTRRTLPGVSEVTTSGDSFLALGSTGSSSVVKGQLYCSSDGLDWQPVGSAIGSEGNRAGVAKGLAASDTPARGRATVVLGAVRQVGHYFTPPGGVDSIYFNYYEPSVASSDSSLLDWRINSFGSSNNASAYTYFVTYANGLFLAGMSDGRLYTAAPAPVINQQSDSMLSVVNGAGSALLVAAAEPGLTYAWTFNGATIAGATAATYPIAEATVANAGTYVATVTSASGSSTTSAPINLTVTTGAASVFVPSWTARNVGGSAGDYTGVAFGAGRYVALSYGSGYCQVAVSTDAVEWKTYPLPINATGRISFVNGQFMICAGRYGDDNLLTSPDGAVWARRSTGVRGLGDIAYANGRYVAVGSGYVGGGSNAATSTDGLIWTAVVIGGGLDLRRIVAHPTRGIFVAQPSSDGNLWTSNDGVAWTKTEQPVPSSGSGVSALTFDGDSFAALVRTGGVYQLHSSPDGRAWQAGATVPAPANFSATGMTGTLRGTGGKAAMMVTGNAGYYAYVLVSSADLMSWRVTPLGTVDSPDVIVRANGLVFLGLRGRLLAAPIPIAYLSNMSVLARAGTASETLTAGVTVGGGTGTKPILIRGIGPTLRSFGVDNALADPTLSVQRGIATLSTNDDWVQDAEIVATSNAVGAFALPASSRDAVIYGSSFPAGGYVIELAGKAGTIGTALIEVYDTDRAGVISASSPRLTNLAARTFGGTGSSTLTAGFTVAGSGTIRVLLRASGPALAPFGLTGLMSDPKLELFRGEAKIAENDNWEVASLEAQTSVGAFPFPRGSRDSVLLATLEPGSYTAQVTAVGGETGVALIEVYELP